MKQNKHTPGPWSVGELDENQFVNVYAADGYSVAIEVQGEDLTEAEANAHLIAAAPELLEACETALGVLYPHFDDDRDRSPEAFASNKILSAIAKARGGE